MKRSSPVTAAAVVAGALCLAAPAAAAPAGVSVSEFAYRAARVQIDPGESVTWTNRGDVAHTVTSRVGSPERFGSEQLDAGATFTKTFTRRGRYAYICTLHPGQMSGVVQVGPDTTAARLTRLTFKRGRTSVRLSFRLSEDAKVKATIMRAGKRVAVLASKTLHEGTGSLAYKPKALAAGRYTVKLVATDAAGNRAKAVAGRFSVPR